MKGKAKPHDCEPVRVVRYALVYFGSKYLVQMYLLLILISMAQGQTEKDEDRKSVV